MSFLSCSILKEKYTYTMIGTNKLLLELLHIYSLNINVSVETQSYNNVFPNMKIPEIHDLFYGLPTLQILNFTIFFLSLDY